MARWPENFPTPKTKWNNLGKIFPNPPHDGKTVEKFSRMNSEMGTSWENFPTSFMEWKSLGKIFPGKFRSVFAAGKFSIVCTHL